MRWGGLLLSVCLLGGAACGESSQSLDVADTRTTEVVERPETSVETTTTTSTTTKTEAAPTTSETTASVLSGEAKPSGFEDLPVPVEATEDPDSGGQDWTYFLPASVSLEELDDWYHRHLPDQLPWQDWKWCRTEPISQSIDRVWHKPGSTSVMGVIIGKNDPEDGGEAFIYLSGDESGPAACEE